jgi:hypothetical protein
VADDEDRGGIDTAAPRGPREIHEREADAKNVPATKYGQYRNASPPSFPRFGGWQLFFLFYPALNHHVHLHACVTDGVLMPAAAAPAGDAPLAFLPAWSSCRRLSSLIVWRTLCRGRENTGTATTGCLP